MFGDNTCCSLRAHVGLRAPTCGMSCQNGIYENLTARVTHQIRATRVEEWRTRHWPFIPPPLQATNLNLSAHPPNKISPKHANERLHIATSTRKMVPRVTLSRDAIPLWSLPNFPSHTQTASTSQPKSVTQKQTILETTVLPFLHDAAARCKPPHTK